MEIRGIGIIDIKALFGVRAIRQQKRIEVVVVLQEWKEGMTVERTGLETDTMSILGVLTGVRGEVNTYGIFHKNLLVRGVYVGSRRMFESLNRALSANTLRPIVDRVFPFGEAVAAYEHLAGGTHFGKVVITI